MSQFLDDIESDIVNQDAIHNNIINDILKNRLQQLNHRIKYSDLSFSIKKYGIVQMNLTSLGLNIDNNQHMQNIMNELIDILSIYDCKLYIKPDNEIMIDESNIDFRNVPIICDGEIYLVKSDTLCKNCVIEYANIIKIKDYTSFNVKIKNANHICLYGAVRNIENSIINKINHLHHFVSSCDIRNGYINVPDKFNNIRIIVSNFYYMNYDQDHIPIKLNIPSQCNLIIEYQISNAVDLNIEIINNMLHSISLQELTDDQIRDAEIIISGMPYYSLNLHIGSYETKIHNKIYKFSSELKKAIIRYRSSDTLLADI